MAMFNSYVSLPEGKWMMFDVQKSKTLLSKKLVSSIPFNPTIEDQNTL